MAKPWMIITGATGFLGGQLVRQLRKEFRIFAFGRRTPKEAGAPEGPGIEWFQVDVGEFDKLREVFGHIRERGGADLLLHLAAYYDFTGEDNPEYLRTNINGTRNVLELASSLNLRRFIYTSSVAACQFPEQGSAVNEVTPPTAPIPYARSKRMGEELLRKYKDSVPSCIVRPAVIFSNWCEYEPLDEFLQAWCSRRWNCRILGGKGESAVPYLHVEDLLSFYIRVVERCDDLDPVEVLLASPDGSTSHLELFREASLSYFESPRRPIMMPAAVAAPGVRFRELLGRLTGRMPFERSWMVEYIDLKLEVDAVRTRRRLDWAPNPKRSVLKSIPAMIDNMKNQTDEWRRRSLQRKLRTLRSRAASSQRIDPPAGGLTSDPPAPLF
ncbi:MAG: NAD(P)-dependent oxidoreductase [bacterium]|nr:NAD(P)-dependent oxidoreductase [bacterium]